MTYRELAGLHESMVCKPSWSYSSGYVYAIVNRHESSRHSRAVGNTAFRIRPATNHC